MYEGFFLDLLLTATINMLPAVVVLLIHGPIFDKVKAIKVCVIIAVLALLITIVFLELGNIDEAPKVTPEIFYGYFNYLILYKIPAERRFKKMNIHLTNNFDSDAQDGSALKNSRKNKNLTWPFVVVLVALLLTNIFWLVAYHNFQNEYAECEARIKSLEMYVDSLKSQLKDAQADAEEYTEADRIYEEYLERAEKERAEEIARWNKNNPDQPLDPETGLPL